MDWLVGILLLAVGIVIGFFVAKYVKKEQSNKTDADSNEQTIKELMMQQASHHLLETKQITEQLAAQTSALKNQIDSYEQLLISQNRGAEGTSLNYFGEHASTYLRNKSSAPTRSKSSAEFQPLDFSSQSSGLFSGNEKVVVKETK
jgi:uncharacterized membrane-anchored protein YhcB (DUF1043 family)